MISRTPILAALLLLFATAITAADRAADSPVYSRRVWQSADGLPEDYAQALAQTADGYLWIGTSGGLVRFDGTRFTVFNHETEPAFRDDSVYCLYTAKDHTLWIGSEGGGLIRYRNGAFRAYGVAEGLTNGFVRVIFEDNRRNLWVGTDAGLFRMQEETLVRIDGHGGVPRVSVHSIWQDREGRLLIGGGGLLILDWDKQDEDKPDGTHSTYYRSSEDLADNSIRTIRQTRDGTVWIGTISGLRKLEQGVRGNPFLAPRMVSGTNISVLAEGRGGELWIGTYGQGLRRLVAGRMERLEAPGELPHNNVLALLEDSEDDIWVGTQGGLLRLSPSAASTITTPDRVPQGINTIYQDPGGALFVAALNGRLFQVTGQALTPAPLPPGLGALPIRNVFRDRAGGLWIGTDGQGVARWQGAETRRYTMKQGLVNDFVRAFCEDRDGGIWIGTDGGLSRWHAGTFQSFGTQDGLAYGSIRVLLLGREGSLWVATDGGLSRYRDGKFGTDALLDSLRGQKIWALHEDAHGGLWIGTQGAGLFLLENRKLSQFTTKDGLPSNKIQFLTEDGRGNLWMSGPSGIASVALRDLEESPRKQPGRLAVRVYSTSEGLSTNRMNGGVQPAGTLAPSGDLWFASTKGAVRIEPDVPYRGSPPPVLIEQVLADDTAVAAGALLRVGPGEGKLEVHYTAIRLRSPERTQFKYWMEGFERDWTDVGPRRIAYYTNIPPGPYRFHVVAYERNDPHNAAEKILDLQWLPHFYQTTWFLALCGLIAMAAAWGAYRLHLRNLRQRFAAVLDERNRLAREMHDTLIQGCIGVSTLLEAASSAQSVSPGIGQELLDRARNEVRATVDEARLAVWNLRQNAGTGNDLVRTLSHLAQRAGLEAGIPVRFENSGTPLALGAEGERGLVMLVREALQNSVRHAAPKHLSVMLRFEGETVHVEISDDGCGFDPAIAKSAGGHHYGLIGMRERVAKLGGELRIASALGQGTQVGLSVPVKVNRQL